MRKVKIDIAATGGEFKKCYKGEADVSYASRPIIKKEMAECIMTDIYSLKLQKAYTHFTNTN